MHSQGGGWTRVKEVEGMEPCARAKIDLVDFRSRWLFMGFLG